MYVDRLVELSCLDQASAAGDRPAEEAALPDRSSEVRLRTRDEDEPDAELAASSHASSIIDALEVASSDTPTAPPPRPTSQPPRPGLGALDEVLFRFSCGDFEGALAASDALAACIPVIIMHRSTLRSEPLGYWALLLVARIDGEAPLGQLLSDVPPSEAVRVVCDLVGRQIIALR